MQGWPMSANPAVLVTPASAPPAGPPAPHASSAAEVVAALGTDAHDGLRGDDAAKRLERHGPNELAQAPPTPWWRRFGRQFADLLVWILIAAAIVSGLLGEWIDVGAIFAIVILNGVLGFVQEGRAEQALAALRKLSSPKAKVVRDGRLLNVAAAELVPGDRIGLEPGDRVPADVRLINSAGLRAEEAALTGESVPSDKDHRSVLDERASLGDRVNMAYMGTSIAAGTAEAVVVATGMSTEMGRIAGLLAAQQPEATPLQLRLAELGRTLLYVVLGIVGLIFVVNLLRHTPLAEAFLLSVSLAVAAVPEGMTAVVTVALALGLQRMARRNALIRRLPSVETLGAVTVICSDKTGTLTRNEMTVRELDACGVRYEVSGGGYAPEGDFSASSNQVDPRATPDLLELLTVGALCNRSQVAHDEATDKWTIVGDPTEGALVVAALKAGLKTGDRDRRVLREIPFSSDRKAMSVVMRRDNAPNVLYTKGAPEVVVGMCTRELRAGAVEPFSDTRREAVLAAAHGMAERALRVLALAERIAANGGEELDETELVFVGLVAMIDPPREEARGAVARCTTAGVRAIMITGDHPDTAQAIARDLGIMRKGDRGIVGNDLDALSEQRLVDEVEQVSVYARVTAEHKLRIVNAWRARGQIVAMTGDGVNDAPAIKAAHVGVAMGITGTDVTKEASDMVLTDDNFVSIVNAVEEGRTIYDNIRKFVEYLLATNVGEVLLMLFATLVGWPAPLFPIQILWINLVTDAVPALALGVEPPEPDVMRREPRAPDERIVTRERGIRVTFYGVLNAGVSAIAFGVVYGGREENLPAARTATFAVLAFTQLLFSFGCRSERFTLFQLGIFTNKWLVGGIAVSALVQIAVMTLPFLAPFFRVDTEGFTRHWCMIAGLSAAPVIVLETAKWLRQRAERLRAPRHA
jgi:Ca2+-transporting ATPase